MISQPFLPSVLKPFCVRRVTQPSERASDEKAGPPRTARRNRTSRCPPGAAAPPGVLRSFYVTRAEEGPLPTCILETKLSVDANIFVCSPFHEQQHNNRAHRSINFIILQEKILLKNSSARLHWHC